MRKTVNHSNSNSDDFIFAVPALSHHYFTRSQNLITVIDREKYR